MFYKIFNLKYIQFILFSGTCLLCFFQSGCAKYNYKSSPVIPEEVAYDFNTRRLDNTDLREFMREYGYSVEKWPLERWDIEALTLAGYFFHPDIQVAISSYGAKKIHEQFALQRINPVINIPLEHHSDTSGNRSPWLIGIFLDLVLEREGKRQARLDKAIAESEIAKLDIQSTGWKLYQELRNNYFYYYSALTDLEQVNIQTELLVQILELLMRRFELGQTSEFEVSATRLEYQRNKLLQTEKQLAMIEAHNALASAIGIPVDALDNINLNFPGTQAMVVDLPILDQNLQEIALKHRLDIKISLQNYAAQEAALRLEIEKQYPDITLSPGFIFDQDDKIWALGAAWILPLLHPQNETGILSALAEREILQKEFLSLQARVINQIGAGKARLKALHTALNEAKALVGDLKKREVQIKKQYELGYSDLLTLKRQMLETVTAEQALISINMAVIKATGQLEDAIQYAVLNNHIRHYKYSD